MNKAVVFGGNGFIGQKLVKELAKDCCVLIADLNTQDAPRLQNVSYADCDFVKQQDFTPFLQDADMVFHLVCTVLPEDGTDNIDKEIQENVFSTIRLLESMKNFRRQKLFFLSSGGTVYGNSGKWLQGESDYTSPICKYGFLKDATEKLLELYHVMYDLPYCVIRLSNPYGTKKRQGQRQGLIPILADCIFNDKEFYLWGNGENTRDYIHIDDAVRAMRAIVEYEGPHRLFNVGSGRGHTINEVVHLLEEKIGILYQGLVCKPSRLCDVTHNVLDISLISECTGWKPDISLEDGIQTLIDQYRQA